jgi:hypothetical protein
MMTDKPPFENIWELVKQFQGQPFQTKKGIKFTYRVENNYVITNRTNYKIPKNDFKKAYDRVPIVGPGEINTEVRGPSYVWAILYDPRISRGKW